ncbi:M15 family metallopeptidase [Clostridium sp. Ade.TY]|uniref:M15 family metallopeptidase n=1 Tax=Clostridium sp. Ade.TY TaxID=1391647 RepID=UPI000401A4E6|nr:M15 family metallopeptidase [Clostridium sp. Ade.TY]
MRRKRYKKRTKIKNRVLKLILIFLITLSLTTFLSGYIHKNYNNSKITESNENKMKQTKENIKDIKTSSNITNILLVNKKYSVDSSYKPSDLVIPEATYNNHSLKMQQPLRKDAATSFENMFIAAAKDNIILKGISGFRSYDYQVSVFNNSKQRNGYNHAEKYVAKPGHSEHQTGLAVDVLSNEYNNLNEGFENTKTFKWLKEHMSEFGFILRYPKGKETITGYNYEPWHLRYVGKDTAEKINNSGITLEEYLNK